VLQAPNPFAHVIRAYGLDPLTPRFGVLETGALYAQGQRNEMLPEGDIPTEGAGTRLMWYPDRAAFRAGHGDGTEWDDANIGDSSVAFGMNTQASGDGSAAFGWNSTAASEYSFAAGYMATANGPSSVALGHRAHTNDRQGSFVFSDRSAPDDTFWAGVTN